MEQELALLWTALGSYVLAGTLAIVGIVLGRRPERWVLTLLCLGLALQSLSLGLRWVRLEHGPFVTMFEILASNVWSLTLIYTLAYWRQPAVRPAAAVVMPILFLMMGWMITTSPEAGHLPPTYHTIWLWFHVAFGKVFLGSVLVAVGLAGVILLRNLPRAATRFANLPASARLEDLAWRFMALGLIFETLMLTVGALWAQDAWGRYWDWDPLETWAFLTWLALAFGLHARMAWNLSERISAMLVLGVFVLAFLTFFGVPFVSTAPHQGAI